MTFKEIILPRLENTDDYRLWENVITIVDSTTVIEIGRCSHWERPHQTRWAEAGGFAWPSGYGSLPQFDWSVRLSKTENEWEITRSKPQSRITIPSRTNQHLQAVIHTIQNNKICIYGFRKINDTWKVIAIKDWIK